MISKKQVAEIRNFFDNYEMNMNQLWDGVTFYERHNNLSDNMTSSKSAENLKSDQQRNEDGMDKMFSGQHSPENQSILSSSTPNLSNSSTSNGSSSSSRLLPPLKPLRKYFYLPEEKIHSNELVKIRQHFDKSYDKQSSSGISNDSDRATTMVERSKIGKTINHNKDFKHPPMLKETFSSSLNECDQKISQSSGDGSAVIQINESSDAVVSSLPPLKPTRITAPTLIKNNNSIVCGRIDPKCGGNGTDLVQQQDDDDDASPSTSDSRQKHHRSRDLKPIKSLTTSERQDHEQQHNLILMNDDCKLLQMQEDERASTSTDETCGDKYCKNSRAQHDRNDSEINGISTINSRVNRKPNLNLDLYFDKELSAWLVERERCARRQIDLRADNDDNTAITNIQMQTKSDGDGGDGDVEWNSSEKLSNETISDGTCNYDNSSSNHHFRFSDSFSSSTTSTTSATCFNSEIDTPLIDARRYDTRANDGISCRSTIFTDGEFLYGPYKFDLFWNEFYQFRDGSNGDDKSQRSNDDEAEKHEKRTHIITRELLKNHDEVDNNAEVSFVRDVEAGRGCGILRNDNNNNNPSNNDRVDIEINVTNCSDDDAPDFTSPVIRNDDVAFDKNFNYVPSDACDRRLIDLMDEGDNYVSKKFPVYARVFGDLHAAQPTSATTIYAERLDAPFILTMAELLNNSEQFNYERDKIVEIADENESKVECSETCDDEKFSNDEQREFIFGVVGQHLDDDTKNEIRFKEHDETIRQYGSPHLHPSSDTKCDELDNCFSELKIEADDRRWAL